MRDFRDDAWGMPKAVVIDNAFDWGADKRPGTPLNESIIYELHVKGFTRLVPRGAGRVAGNLRRRRQLGGDQVSD